MSAITTARDKIRETVPDYRIPVDVWDGGYSETEVLAYLHGVQDAVSLSAWRKHSPYSKGTSLFTMWTRGFEDARDLRKGDHRPGRGREFGL